MLDIMSTKIEKSRFCYQEDPTKLRSSSGFRAEAKKNKGMNNGMIMDYVVVHYYSHSFRVLYLHAKNNSSDRAITIRMTFLSCDALVEKILNGFQVEKIPGFGNLCYFSEYIVLLWVDRKVY